MSFSKFLMAAMVVGTLTAPAAAFPDKPIELIVPFSPGGGTDVAARSVAMFMEKYLGDGAKIAVIDKPGAGGEIGWTLLTQANPDGYTIGMINPPGFIAPMIEGKTKYQLDSFQTIGNIVLDPGILVVGKDSPYNSLKELIDASVAAPGAIVVGISGAAGSSEHIGILSLNRSAKTTFTPAFFSGTAPARQALLGGHVAVATMNLSDALPLIRSGDIKLLGIMSENRSPYLPDAPTFKEQGFDLVITSSRGMAAPTGIPADVLAKLEAALKAAMADPEYLKVAQRAEIPLAYMNAVDYRTFLDDQSARLSQIWQVTPWR